MAANSKPICSSDRPRVDFSAWSWDRPGIGFRGTPDAADRDGSDAHRYRELMAATLRLKVRGFMSPASTSSRSWDNQSWANDGSISLR
jgi:hypothetical protein